MSGYLCGANSQMVAAAILVAVLAGAAILATGIGVAVRPTQHPGPSVLRDRHLALTSPLQRVTHTWRAVALPHMCEHKFYLSRIGRGPRY